MDKLKDILEQSPLFSSLDHQESFDEIIRQANYRDYYKGEFVAFEGDIWPYLMLVGFGQVNALKESSEGRRLVITTLEPGDGFWGTAFFNEDAPMPVHLEAVTNARVYLWKSAELQPILLENSKVLWELTRQMAARMQQASEIVEGLAFQPVSARVAKFIVERYGETLNVPVARDLTLDEIAAKVGSTREQVCRTLYRFADKDLIKITRTEFILRDKSGLEDLMEQN